MTQADAAFKKLILSVTIDEHKTFIIYLKQKTDSVNVCLQLHILVDIWQFLVCDGQVLGKGVTDMGLLM